MKFHSQSGIAIGAILFIIALLAILGAAIAASNGFFTEGTTTEAANTSAYAILQYSDIVAAAVQRVVNENGCSPTQINFNNSITSGYSNPNAPSNNSCDVFNILGGSILPQSSQPSWVANGNNGFGGWMYTGSGILPGIGTGSCCLLLITLPLVTQSICAEINTILGITPATPNNSSYPYASTGTGQKFAGTYGGYGWTVTAAGAPAFVGKMAGCMVINPGANGANSYYFYEVLLVQ